MSNGRIDKREKVDMERDYRYLIIFGAVDKKRPYLALNMKTEDGVQKFFSCTNYNLFLEDPDEARHLSLGSFIKHLGEDVTTKCRDCRREKRFCPLFVSSVSPEVPVSIKWRDSTEELVVNDRVNLHPGGFNLGQCLVYDFLLSMSETEAEKKFLAGYTEYAFEKSNWRGDQFLITNAPGVLMVPDRPLFNNHEWAGRFQNYATAWNYFRQRYFVNDYLWSFLRHLLDLVQYPALIPQVWLNYIHDANLGPLDSEKAHLDERPSRVDFVMLCQGRKRVIEIDDPGHYAVMKDGRLVASEEEYTKNLRIERRFKWDGYEIHRFSNWEINNAFNIYYFMAVLGLEDPSWVSADLTAEQLPF